MEMQDMKYVMVIDKNIPSGLIANTAAVLGITLGKLFPQAVGDDVYDKTGNCHLGITKLPVLILQGNSALLKELREKLYQPEFNTLTTVDFSDVAQSCNIYDEFTKKLAGVPVDSLSYFGIAICGNKKQVNKLTGSLPLLK